MRGVRREGVLRSWALPWGASLPIRFLGPAMPWGTVHVIRFLGQPCQAEPARQHASRWFHARIAACDVGAIQPAYSFSVRGTPLGQPFIARATLSTRAEPFETRCWLPCELVAPSV